MKEWIRLFRVNYSQQRTKKQAEKNRVWPGKVNPDGHVSVLYIQHGTVLYGTVR